MTMPAPTAQTAAVAAIPPANYPMVVHVVSDPMFPPKVAGAPEEPVHWAVSKPHPFVNGFTVLRMFLDAGGVEVYSISDDKQVGMRDSLPVHRVRLAQESMPVDIFLEEVQDAEDGDPDDPEDPDGPEVPDLPGAAVPAANGQQPS